MESGIKLAKQEAEKFFLSLDPQKDSLFFASSNEARAIETAGIYREIAHAKGFEVITPKNSRSNLSDEITNGEVRVIDQLSINSENLLIDNLFTPPMKRAGINWNAVTPELKEKYEQASKIIEANDKGSFGANFAEHGDKIKKIFPELVTAEELYKGKFGNLKKLAKFGLEKIKESKNEKNIKILAFGHENYLMYAIQNLFKEEGINNCETLHIETDGEEIKGKFRGKEATL